jgi:hypothetical protein
MKKSLQKEIEEDPVSLVRAILESDFWLSTIETNNLYTRFEGGKVKRFEDDSPKGYLTVAFSEDGDGWIQVLAEPDPDDFNMTFRFRMPMIGGGQSPRTRVALLILAEAIRLDNEQYPQHRG